MIKWNDETKTLRVYRQEDTASLLGNEFNLLDADGVTDTSLTHALLKSYKRFFDNLQDWVDYKFNEVFYVDENQYIKCKLMPSRNLDENGELTISELSKDGTHFVGSKIVKQPRYYKGLDNSIRIDIYCILEIMMPTYDEPHRTIPVPFLSLPYLSPYGKFNLDGKWKALNMRMSDIPGINFSVGKKKTEYNIAFTIANQQFTTKTQASSNFTVKAVSSGEVRHELDLARIVAVAMNAIGDNSFMSKARSNTAQQGISGIIGVTQDTLDNLQIRNFLYKFVHNPMYKLGPARYDINNHFKMETALGKHIAQSYEELGIHVGDVVTKDMLLRLRRKDINYVVTFNPMKLDTKYKIARPIILPVPFPRGSRVPQYIRTKYDVNVTNFPEDWLPPEFDKNGNQVNILAGAGEQLTADLMQLYLYLNPTAEYIEVVSGQKTLKYYFTQVHVGNHWMQAKEYFEDSHKIPAGMSADDWIYTYNNTSSNPMPATQEQLDVLNAHDLEAIFYDHCYIYDNNYESKLYNRDTAFLKQISLVDKAFATSLDRAFNMTFNFKTNSKNIESILKDWGKDSFGKFGQLSMTFQSQLNDSSNGIPWLSVEDTTNASAEVSQTHHTNPKSSRAPAEARYLALPYYGRLCPFETPASGKIGLVNSKTAMSKVDEDGNILVAYYRVIANSNGFSVSRNKIFWFTPKEEFNKIFIDSFNVEMDGDKILSTECLARVPNTEVGEPFIISRINLKHIDTRQYKIFINVSPEQILSTTGCLVPFAGADNATRLTYGLAQIKQSVYLIDTQKPRVTTFMYDKLLKHYNCNSVVPSPFNAEILDYSGYKDVECIKVRDDDTGEVKMWRRQDNFMHMYGTVGFTVVIPNKGTHVKIGDPLFANYYAPYTFGIQAPYDGDVVMDAFTHEPDMFYVRRNGYTCQSVSDGINNGDVINIPDIRVRVAGQTVVPFSHAKMPGDKVKAGEFLTEAPFCRGGSYTPSRNALVIYQPKGYNHEDGVVASKAAATKYTSLIMHKYKKTLRYDTSGLAYTDIPPTGTYCKPGEVIGKVYETKSKDQDQEPIQTLLATHKHHGFPYEKNVIKNKEDNTIDIEIFLLNYNRLRTGDKMTGRHGNKGVVSKVYENSEMPVFINGLIPDFILNPHGISSRMNVGQMYDAHMGFVATLLDIQIQSDPFNGATANDVSKMVNMVYDIVHEDPTSAEGIQAIAKRYDYDYPMSLCEHIFANRSYYSIWKGCFNRHCEAEMYDPVKKQMIRTPVTFGISYYFKQMQEAEEKIAYRSGPIQHTYQATTSAPHKDSLNPQGQRLAEMELVNLVSYGCKDLLDETMNEKSDNDVKRTRIHLEQAGLMGSAPVPTPINRAFEIPRSLINLNAYLMGMGLKLVFEGDGYKPEMVNINAENYNIQQVLHEYDASKDIKQENVATLDVNQIGNLSRFHKRKKK